jgi:tetratricopeptide (TPR) repeat protein
MRPSWPIVSGLLLISAVAGAGQERLEPALAAAHGRASALRAQALELGYSLDHQQALATFEQSIAADPDEPAGYRLAAATIWITLLFQQGAITVDDYLGQARAEVTRAAPDAALAAQFHGYLQRARTIADERLRQHADDADAHFQAGAVSGLEASYIATIDGRLGASVGAARRAFSEHSRVLELDPGRDDAGLVVGLYRCAVAELSGLPRLFAFLAGFRGDRDRGLRLVEEAANHPGEVQPNALFTLVLLYNRAGRYDDALRVLGQLQDRFPRNRLLRLEAAGTALRAKRPAEARASLEAGLAQLARDRRPRAPGEEARWRYAYGTALAALNEIPRAVNELSAALAAATRDWLRGRIHKELGTIAERAGDRPRARDDYERAARLCRQDKDTACADDARALLKTLNRREE